MITQINDFSEDYINLFYQNSYTELNFADIIRDYIINSSQKPRDQETNFINNLFEKCKVDKNQLKNQIDFIDLKNKYKKTKLSNEITEGFYRKDNNFMLNISYSNIDQAFYKCLYKQDNPIILEFYKSIINTMLNENYLYNYEFLVKNIEIVTISNKSSLIPTDKYWQITGLSSETLKDSILNETISEKNIISSINQIYIYITQMGKFNYFNNNLFLDMIFAFKNSTNLKYRLKSIYIDSNLIIVPFEYSQISNTGDIQVEFVTYIFSLINLLNQTDFYSNLKRLLSNIVFDIFNKVNINIENILYKLDNQQYFNNFKGMCMSDDLSLEKEIETEKAKGVSSIFNIYDSFKRITGVKLVANIKLPLTIDSQAGYKEVYTYFLELPNIFTYLMLDYLNKPNLSKKLITDNINKFTTNDITLQKLNINKTILYIISTYIPNNRFGSNKFVKASEPYAILKILNITHRFFEDFGIKIADIHQIRNIPNKIAINYQDSSIMSAFYDLLVDISESPTNNGYKTQLLNVNLYKQIISCNNKQALLGVLTKLISAPDLTTSTVETDKTAETIEHVEIIDNSLDIQKITNEKEEDITQDIIDESEKEIIDDLTVNIVSYVDTDDPKWTENPILANFLKVYTMLMEQVDESNKSNVSSFTGNTDKIIDITDTPVLQNNNINITIPRGLKETINIPNIPMINDTENIPIKPEVNTTEFIAVNPDSKDNKNTSETIDNIIDIVTTNLPYLSTNSAKENIKENIIQDIKKLKVLSKKSNEIKEEIEIKKLTDEINNLSNIIEIMKEDQNTLKFKNKISNTIPNLLYRINSINSLDHSKRPYKLMKLANIASKHIKQLSDQYYGQLISNYKAAIFDITNDRKFKNIDFINMFVTHEIFKKLSINPKDEIDEQTYWGLRD